MEHKVNPVMERLVLKCFKAGYQFNAPYNKTYGRTDGNKDQNMCEYLILIFDPKLGSVKPN